MNKPSTGYVDIVTLSNLVDSVKGKRLNDWRRTKRIESLLNSLSSSLGVEKEGKLGSGALIEYTRGYKVWLHPNLIEAYKTYLSSDAPVMSDYLYLIKAGDTQYYKIGVTSDKTRRLSKLQSGSPFELKYVICTKKENAKSLEQAIHNELDVHHVRGEWFELTPLLVKRVIKTWFR